MFGICIPRRDLNTFILDLSDAIWTPFAFGHFESARSCPAASEGLATLVTHTACGFCISLLPHIWALLPSTPSTQQTARSSTKIERCKYFIHVDNDIYDLSIIRRWQSSSCPRFPHILFLPSPLFPGPFLQTATVLRNCVSDLTPLSPDPLS